ncbi:MAG: serpin family protein [Myxococcota bacterium]
MRGHIGNHATSFTLIGLLLLGPGALLAPGCQDGGDAGEAPAPDTHAPEDVAEVEGPQDIETAQSSLSRDLDPEVPAADLETLVADHTAFAFDLYEQVRGSEEGNLLLSPHSVSIALAMTYAGAEGTTAEQMADALRLTLPEAKLHPAFNALDLHLSSLGEGATGKDGEPFRLDVTNALWGQTGYPFLDGFLDTLAVNYGAAMHLLDFATAPESSRETINQWVSDQTADRIPNLLPQGSISTLTRLVLTNAVYFNASWDTPFEEEDTADAAFHRLDGSTAQVPTMRQTEEIPYAEGDGWKAVRLPYDGEEVAMDLVVPDAGTFADFEASFGPDVLAAVDGAWSTTNVNLHMPRFEFESAANLVGPMEALGMLDAFDPSAADFSGMDGTESLFVTGIFHKTFIAVDEAGTEAAAATAVVVSTTSVPPPPEEVHLDRPFFTLIRDVETGAILFVGRVVDPSA